MTIKYKYKEDKFFSEFKTYIDSTYGEHYKTDENVQCFDAWLALGDATPTFRNTAMKYLWRYGKKNGNNKGDLVKAIHYIMMCLYNDHYKTEITKPRTQKVKKAKKILKQKNKKLRKK